jgi:hypothetical protein
VIGVDRGGVGHLEDLILLLVPKKKGNINKELEFLNFSGARESIPRNQFRQAV